MFDVEDDNWWYVGLRKLVLDGIESFTRANNGPAVLDAGCGTGGMLKECKDYTAFGMDTSEASMHYCRMRSLKNLLRGSVNSMPFKHSAFNIVISLDVLCHTSVPDDVKALKEIYRVIDHDGVLLINLPAYHFLKSRHDESFHQDRRYTARNLKEKVAKAGFRIERISYRNTVLFPLVLFMRIAGKLFPSGSHEKESDMRRLPRLLNSFLQQLLLLENKMIIRGVSFPFGLSVFCVARKKMDKAVSHMSMT